MLYDYNDGILYACAKFRTANDIAQVGLPKLPIDLIE
jgi:hypothetical protein